MWPLRGERATNTPAGYYREPGTSFRLVVRVEADAAARVREALLAWIVFGGYGGRTRRGLGSLMLRAVGEGSLALPEAPTREALARAFGRDIFAWEPSPATHVPRFAGAALAVGSPVPQAERAWETALTVLREFRQGTSGGAGDRAREPDPGGGRRPSVSNWPEADKVRHLAAHGGSGRWSHKPRYGPDPAWPRAELGLPIVGRFQTNGRDGSRLIEPDPFEIRWEPASEARWPRDRLASPLVVKAMPLADGRFAPCLLWFERSYPPGRVVLHGAAGRVRNSEAPFGKLLGEGDNPLYRVLDPSFAASAQGEAAGRRPARGLRDRFFTWAEKRYGLKVIAR
ncbi:MAG: hypothetical protein IRZ11_08755 [Clostridia bacterium]|nr:hypothetical protein [Clostridia bacterium]